LLTGCHDALGVLAAERHPGLWASSTANYFRWLIDACGQLEGVRAYPPETGVEAAIVIRSGAPPFVRESLTILGLDPARCSNGRFGGHPLRHLTITTWVAVPVRTLVISAWCGYGHGCSGKSLKWLRAAFLPAAS
jgi:hypothetical protein